LILDRIIDSKRKRLIKAKELLSVEDLIKNLQKSKCGSARDFEKSLKGGSMAIIAEIKRASPSKGIIRQDFEPAQIAREYQMAGVQAVSVLTEADFFMGDDAYIGIVRRNCDKPVLRKDFIIDVWQIYQSKLLSADAILLIARILPYQELKRFYQIATGIGIKCLIEVATCEEIESALETGASIIGINNRNLSDFSVSLKKTQILIKHIPKGITVVSESGIDKSNVKELKDMGVNAILVGETIMRQNDCFAAVNELRDALND